MLDGWSIVRCFRTSLDDAADPFRLRLLVYSESSSFRIPGSQKCLHLPELGLVCAPGESIRDCSKRQLGKCPSIVRYTTRGHHNGHRYRDILSSCIHEREYCLIKKKRENKKRRKRKFGPTEGKFDPSRSFLRTGLKIPELGSGCRNA